MKSEAVPAPSSTEAQPQYPKLVASEIDEQYPTPERATNGDENETEVNQ